MIPLSLYVHLPWCVRKCPYCDFNSHRAPQAIPERDYVDRLVDDLRHDAALVDGRLITSIFFGGGTPSLFAPGEIGRVIAAAANVVGVSTDLEVTLEANPGTIEHAPFAEFASAGVTRFSLGVQSFDDAMLKRLGRIHGGKEAAVAVESAVQSGAQVNLDLMYALPEQTATAALDDIHRAVALRPDHISHYQLTLEPNTLFAAKPPPLPDHDSAWDMQESCQRVLAEAGYRQYEVSAYALTDRQCRHNRNYWEFGDYLGIGAGAHGKLSRRDQEGSLHVLRTLREKHPTTYLRKDERLIRHSEVSASELEFEFVLNALRLVDGFEKQLLFERTGIAFDPHREPWNKLLSEGLVEQTATHVRTTSQGASFLDEITGRFLDRR